MFDYKIKNSEMLTTGQKKIMWVIFISIHLLILSTTITFFDRFFDIAIMSSWDFSLESMLNFILLVIVIDISEYITMRIIEFVISIRIKK